MKPILFNTPMVRALLENRKTTTRRVIKPEPEFYIGDWEIVGRNPDQILTDGWGNSLKPVYQVGDILYVRETWCEFPKGRYHFKADYGTERDEEFFQAVSDVKWHPSIHMPHEATRIFLRVVSVKPERLQNTKYFEFLSEGLPYRQFERDLRTDFIVLWDGTIKDSDRDKYSWNANPWVWVIEFERIENQEAADA
ncbi:MULTISPECIES: hypothetical protein [Caproicibacterium]|uniref:Uncharacterized protein n=1 Tax=Caproicibacterium argilliputei TaxID=3030016 RepID=A0AA97H2B3_9FIRM|nr:hypothetical protein [Caproicibacterium argilliputei]WOC33451.1 hypothetical protein PXC00_06185 [Caproicibacterium argilliputei]WOC33454.1 hypothetical protein PXC00_06200 [Caproicibacterium argilliputei]WOC33457.1 hypothetical protein PXC00_06215 [Caproicibacterium argilliputei]